MRRGILLLTALCLLLCGCQTPVTEAPEGSLSIYYAVIGEDEWSGAVSDESYLPLEGIITPETLMRRLLQGPTVPELRSPIPTGTRVKSLRLEGGVAYLDLSEPYAGLFGIEQTLADACITLTLCQFDEIDGVSISVEGRRLLYYNQEILSISSYILDEITVDRESANQ